MSNVHEQKLLRDFGRRVAQARKNQGITQQELAEKMNMSVVAIAYIETGKRWVRIGTLDKLAKCLKVKTPDLF